MKRLAIQLFEEDAPPVRASELARWTGMSQDFIRREIAAGVIEAAVRVGQGKHRVYRVPVRSAIRYLRQIGVFRPVVKRGSQTE